MKVRGVLKVQLLVFAATLLVYIQYCVNMLDLLYAVPPFIKKENACVSYDFRDALLVITFNWPHYHHIPQLLRMYRKTFPNIIFCGPKNSITIYPVEKMVTENGYFSYAECAAHAMRKYPNYTGYFSFSDDVLLNVWNLKGFDRQKLWQSLEMTCDFGENNITTGEWWYWWDTPYGLSSCGNALHEISRSLMYQHHYKRLIESKNNSNYGNKFFFKYFNNYTCFAQRSDIFYIPANLAKDFMELSSIFKKANVFLEIAIPTITRMLATDTVNLNGIYMPGNVGSDPVRKSEMLLRYYNFNLHFMHPFKFHYGNDSAAGLDFIKNKFEKMINITDGKC